MNWKQFLKVAYPPDLKTNELHRGIVWKSQRYLGIYIAYMFYNLGISANVIDLLRVFLSLLAFYLISKLPNGNIYIATIGVFLLYFQVFLDFVDGAVARAFAKISDFGEGLDGLPNALSRSIILVLFGIFTGNNFFIILSVLASYLLTNFIPNTVDKIPNNGLFKLVKNIYSKVLSVVAMLIILPFLIILCAFLNLSLVIFSYVILGIYIFLAILWVAICVFKK